MSKSDVMLAVWCVCFGILFVVRAISEGRQEEKRLQTIEQRLQALENK